MPLRFSKMHGLGNDYVYVDLFRESVSDAPALARVISDRHRGVGSDGLILIAPPRDAEKADVRMIMYNADGSEGEMCGNGVRCVAKYSFEHGLARRNPLRVETGAGVLTLALILRGDSVEGVRVDMGRPILEPGRIPVLLDGDRIIDRPLELPGVTLRMTCVSVGNPHAVFFVEDLARVPLREWGQLVERHRLFPQRVNAHFVQLRNRQYLEMVTWERGSGVTQACGTGATAVCVAGVLTGRTERAITARLPGGELELEWAADDHVYKTGPAAHVFDGVWPG